MPHTNHPHYPGLYRGIVVDNKDPEELGRLRIQIPQVFGVQTTNWIWPSGGQVSQTKLPHATVSSNISQTVSAANTATVVGIDIVEDTYGVSLKNGSRITVSEYGDYFFQFSAQFAKAGSSASQADIWLRKNGVDIPRTNSRVTLQGNPNEVLIALSYILDLDANDYVEVVMSSSDTAVGIVARTNLTSPTRPDIPSIIATINLIGNYLPRANTAVWVAFEGGDPNFPVWIGSC
jgi:hypothetical protein